MIRTMIAAAVLLCMPATAMAQTLSKSEAAAIAAAQREPELEKVIPRAELDKVMALSNEVNTARQQVCQPNSPCLPEYKATSTLMTKLNSTFGQAALAREKKNRKAFDAAANKAKAFNADACAILTRC